MNQMTILQADVLSEHYDDYKEIQLEIFKSEKKRTSNSIFIVGALLFGSDLLFLLTSNLVNATTLISILVVPALFVAVAFIALREPLVAIVVAILLLISLWAITIAVLGGKVIISGLIVKAIIIYFLLAGLGSAKEAIQARKNFSGA